MQTLILQIAIKQWDKSQRSPEHIAFRAALPDCFKVMNKPEFLILGTQCLIDQHTIDCIASEHSTNPNVTSHGRELKKAMLANGSVKLDRFIISKDSNSNEMTLTYQAEKAAPLLIGSLSNDCIKVQYQWRHRVEKDNQIFWLYEEVTLNAALIDNFDKNTHENVFLGSQAQTVFIAPENA
jgi:hypothetical protein